MPRASRAALVSALVAWIVVALLAVSGAAAVHSGGAAAEPHTDTVAAGGSLTERVCFSARLWSADGDERPCFAVYGPLEDGSARIYLGVRAHYWRACTIPSTSELRSLRSIKCSETVRDD